MQETISGQKPLTAFHLKMIALATMVIDHVGAVFFFPPLVNSLMRGIGRVAFPIYAFLVAEGCRYTRSREKYLLRLGVFALISELPFDRVFYPRLLQIVGLWENFLRATNVFYTLFLAVACIHIWETLRRQTRRTQLLVLGVFSAGIAALLIFVRRPWPKTILALVCLACALLVCRLLAKRMDQCAAPDRLSNILAALPLLPVLMLAENLQCDYTGFGVFLIFLLYLAKSRKTQITVLVAGMFFLYGFASGLNLINWVSSGFSEPPTLHGALLLCCSMLTVALVYFYNGQRGRKIKWAFYAAYPAHLAVLAVLRAYLCI
ncbi:MAG: hypothetical protein HDT20_00280 [Oscillibacter sp.]|nr:hypothetical protein [Oscillibacter sp.]